MGSKIEKIKGVIAESIRVKNEILNKPDLIAKCEEIAEKIAEAFRQDKKVLFCGNGGSAADAQHLAAEFSGRFYFDRPPLDAEALHCNSSYLTAVGNDYGYDQVFSRVLKAKGRKGDFIIGISTSGNSGNILKAFEVAREREMIIVAMTGESGGKMKDNCDYLLNVPSSDTPRIQESHIMLGHIICELVEDALFEKP
ncbi:MAG: D-sedoheptulose 7-phosphate isomerase [Fimbriimonadaceae bacterium]|nr:D-sedoheptulose 7-phosphate isomerase [Chitinophagales bacterium]